MSSVNQIEELKTKTVLVQKSHTRTHKNQTTKVKTAYFFICTNPSIVIVIYLIDKIIICLRLF